MSTLLVPKPKDVRDLLTDLLRRKVAVSLDAPYAPGTVDRASFAVYVDDSLRTMAVIVLDLELSVWVGAAIGLVPAGGAEACIDDRQLSPLLSDNLAEVLHNCTSLLNAEGRPHIKLHATYPPGAEVPLDLPGHAAILGRRLDLTVDVAGYGRGRLSVVCRP